METRQKKFWLKRSQMQKINQLANSVIKDFENEMEIQRGDFVKVPKSKLKWLIDLVRWNHGTTTKKDA